VFSIIDKSLQSSFGSNWDTSLRSEVKDYFFKALALYYITAAVI